MKIRILTFHAAPNYGAVLQAYALQQYLRGLGHDASFIDYRPPYLTTGGSFWFPRSRWHLRANLVIAYQKLTHLRNQFGGMREQHRLFDEFINSRLVMEGRRYRSIEQLRRDPPEGDLYICGSDQIWNPSEQYGVDPACFLDFGDSGIPRISYAASFGRPVLPLRHHSEIARLLGRLDRISVRESSGAKLVGDFSGKMATVVPDPTLLIDWERELKDVHVKHSAYVFSYVLRSGDGVAEMQKEVMEHYGCELLQPYNPHQRWDNGGTTVPLSPLEWVAYIGKARFVLTNSFHGTVFAILNRKPFVSLGLSGAKSGFSERVRHLLQSLGLEERMLRDGDRRKFRELLVREVDWNAVAPKMRRMVETGRGFLGEAIDLSKSKDE